MIKYLKKQKHVVDKVRVHTKSPHKEHPDISDAKRVKNFCWGRQKGFLNSLKYFQFVVYKIYEFLSDKPMKSIHS